MSDKVQFVIDDVDVEGTKGQTILDAARDAGIYIPHLCAHKDLEPYGACRVCTVLVNGRPQAACTQPIAPGIIVENDTDKVNNMRRQIIEMLFVEGNHFCPFCEKSGNCELQALAYRLGLPAMQLPYQWPERELDATHPEVMIDRNRCILCARCVRASKDIDGKHVFGFAYRGAQKVLTVNASTSLSDTELGSADKAVEVCPVGSIIKKHVGFATPIGRRLYDHEPIGSDIESKKK
jgi:[NiFe] hydrogenase diaphorase moiety small subunit